MPTYSKDWPAISRGVLEDEPYCRECAGYGIRRRASAVDHIVPLREGGTDDRANLQPLCLRHHARKTVRDSRAARRAWPPTRDTMDRDALILQFAAMWTRDPDGLLLEENDASGRLAPLVAVGVTNAGWRVVEVGAAMPDAEAIRSSLERGRGEPDEAESVHLLEVAGTGVVTARGPSYLIPPSLPDVRLEDDAALVWSEEAGSEESPYPTRAAVVLGGRVVSACCTVRLSDQAAEAGVDTLEDFRGRGFASAATSHWASRMRATGRELFYSTSEDNHASQRVAERLGLHRIGVIWTLRRP